MIWRVVGVWEALNGVAMLVNVHDRHTGNLAQSSLKILIACRHDVAPVRLNTVHDAVISICALVRAWIALKSGVLRDTQCHAVLGTELLEFGNDAVRDNGDTFREQAVHHRGEYIELVLNREIDEVSIDQDAVRRAKRGVVREPQMRGCFLDSVNDCSFEFLGLLLLLLRYKLGISVALISLFLDLPVALLGGHLDLQPWVIFLDSPLHDGELSGLLRLGHGCSSVRM